MDTPIDGNVTIGIWLGGHKRDRDKPAFAYQFHTAMLDGDQVNECITLARALATPYAICLLVPFKRVTEHVGEYVNARVLMVTNLCRGVMQNLQLKRIDKQHLCNDDGGGAMQSLCKHEV